jgi:hypothetical protein
MQSKYVPAFVCPVFLGLLSVASSAQQPILTNGDFESDRAGDPPKGWFLPKACAEAGYELEVTDTSAAGGEHSAALSGTSGHAQIFGNCMRALDAAPFRGKRVRFSAAVRCEPADEDSRAQLWLRVDLPNQGLGFFDNMDDRPIRGGDWQRHEIVGDIAADAESIALGMMLLGGGAAFLDDVTLEVTTSDAPTTGRSLPAMGEPGLAVAALAAQGFVIRDSDATTLRFPLPLAYRDQTPLTFHLEIEPADVDARVSITAGQGPNRVLELELRDVEEGTNLKLRYESVVLVAPSSFDAVPEHAAFPAGWPEEAAAWLAPTWCCDAGNERIQAIAAEIKAGSHDVDAVVEGVLSRSQLIFHDAESRVQDLTAVEALDKQGSCTSCANLVAALLRASGLPARVLAGYPLWSGPLQTHYIVETFLPGYGWYPVESTMGRAPWPNCHQLNVSIVPIENESKALAGPRSCAAGAVPFMTLTEYADDSPILLDGTLKPHCDHEARMLRPLSADADEWRASQDWARARWAEWLESKPEIRSGKLEFGPASDALAAKTLEELRSELR